MTLSADEFLRRFFLHVLPHGFVRIRFFGFLANRSRANMLPLCRQLLAMPSQEQTQPSRPLMLGHQRVGNVLAAPGAMVIIGTLTAQQLRWVAFQQNTVDTS